MKVLHITTSDRGGAGLCCLRIHNALLCQDVESKVVTLRNHAQESEEYEYGYKRWLLFSLFIKIFSLLFRMIGCDVTLYNKVRRRCIENNSCFSLPFSPVNLLKCPLVDWADVIHLHWVNNYLDYPSFLEGIKKPVVWTLHDENFFYGLAHYGDMHNLNDELELNVERIKANSIKKVNDLTVVLLSSEFQKKFQEHELLKGREVKVIHNSVDTCFFYPISKSVARSALNLSSDYIIFGFTAFSITDPHKGLNELCEALNIISNHKIKILAIGNYPKNCELNDRVIPVGFVNPSTIRSVLSACDYFAMPSFQEAFSQSPLEAMSCGLPVVAFPVSGCSELITPENGVICKDFTVNSLVEGINKMLNKNFNRDWIRQDMCNRFSPEIIAKQYIDVYRSILKKE